MFVLSTFFMYRHKDKPYHIDYCFVSTDLLEKIRAVDIGEYDVWTKYSDHVPLIVTFELMQVKVSGVTMIASGTLRSF